MKFRTDMHLEKGDVPRMEFSNLLIFEVQEFNDDLLNCRSIYICTRTYNRKLCTCREMEEIVRFGFAHLRTHLPVLFLNFAVLNSPL